MNGALSVRLSVDEPWPGLDVYTEADRQFFRGRDGETAELLGLVQREPLTVLLGRSGVGKTSLLQAGLFPLLRAENLLPVSVRLDYLANSVPLREQVQSALRAACADAGVEAPGHAVNEGLWSFFHRRDTEFWSRQQQLVTPVIVFDQFEEIFTLGARNEAVWRSAREFLDELAALVENRTPPAVKALLEEDPERIARLDFERRGCKLLLCFREDYLADFEDLRSRMPSLMRNRLRLRPLDHAQARAVIDSGAHLVEDAVAERIIDSVRTGGSPSADLTDRIEIEPALLSLTCMALNGRRQRAGESRISAALVPDMAADIFADFYDQLLSGVAAGIRLFIEDELITPSGRRDSRAYDDALARPGVAEVDLHRLIAGRLLRVDLRSGFPRLEFTHDLLAWVAVRSRDARLARETAWQHGERSTHVDVHRKRKGALLLVAAVMVLVLAGLAVWQAMVARDSFAQVAAMRHAATAEKARADALAVEAARLRSGAPAPKGKTD